MHTLNPESRKPKPQSQGGPRRAPHSPLCVGFTLIELLVVIAADFIFSSQAVAQAPRPAYNALYVFGGSWSGTTDGIYWQGRWSNGPMWPEFLSTNLGISYVASNNFARGGSSTARILTNDIARMGNPTNAERSLVAYWGLDGDVSNLLYPSGSLVVQRLTNDVLWASMISRAVANLTNSLELLYAKGARSIMVVEMDDWWQPPSERNGPLSKEPNRSRLIARVSEFNQAASAALNVVDAAKPDLRLHRFPFRQLWNKSIENYAAFGFARADLGALDDSAISDKSFSGPGRNHVFWDNAHPTTKTHAIWAGWMSDFLKADRLERLIADRPGPHRSPLVIRFHKLNIGRTYRLQISSDLVQWNERGTYEALESVGFMEPSGTRELMDRLNLFFRLVWNE